METKKTIVLLSIALLVVMALTGSVQALVEPIGGQVNSAVAENQIATLYLDSNPADCVTVPITDNPGYEDYYTFIDIEPMLLRNGYTPHQSYDATVVMYCSGEERDINQNPGSQYTNTLRNTTPSTAHFTGVYDGNPKYPPMMNLESCAAEEIFSKTIYTGWNLVSLPLVPKDNSISAVLSTVSYDAVYRYNATSKRFESAGVIYPGTGYFVHATSECTWEYPGAVAYTSMDISLEHGLNMVGWLNCSEDVGDALSSISGDYYYVARWNTAAEKFEVYNPAAPPAFNDFTTMDRGTGYFISAKQDCTLYESC